MYKNFSANIACNIIYLEIFVVLRQTNRDVNEENFNVDNDSFKTKTRRSSFRNFANTNKSVLLMFMFIVSEGYCGFIHR